MKRRLRSIGFNRHVVVLSSARMADAFCNSLLIVILPLYIVQTPRSGFLGRLPEEALIGILISLAALMFALMQPLAAAISDRTRRRKPFIILGLIILSISTLGYIPAHSVRALVALRVTQGFGIAFTIPTALALISAYADKGRVGAAMGVFSTSRMIGFAIGPLVGGLLMVHISFAAAFIAGAIGAVASLLLVLFLVPEVRGERARIAPKRGNPGAGQADRDAGSAHAGHPGGGTEAGARSDPTVAEVTREQVRAAMRQLYVLGVAVFVMAISISLIAAVEPEMNRRLGQTAIGFGVAFSMLTVGRFLFQIPVGHWSDRIGRKPLIVAGMVAMIPLTVLQGYAGTTFWLSLDRFLLGVATALLVAPGYAMVADLALPGMLVRQMSLVTMAFGLGVATGPMLSGFLAGVAGFEAPFQIGGAASLVAAILVAIFVKESFPTKKQSTA